MNRIERLKYRKYGFLDKSLFLKIKRFLSFGLIYGMRVKISRSDKFRFVGFSIPIENISREDLEELDYRLDVLQEKLKDAKK